MEASRQQASLYQTPFRSGSTIGRQLTPWRVATGLAPAPYPMASCDRACSGTTTFKHGVVVVLVDEVLTRAVIDVIVISHCG